MRGTVYEWEGRWVNVWEKWVLLGVHGGDIADQGVNSCAGMETLVITRLDDL